ncbi:hypothetical protein CEV31_0742 [Brucella thiophenivorans]|uniref:Uncharacterized protein n=1 Tax=Brucella thiophenivorans TaxID=571255 RepID=A0A256G389_9HYPH|nr:hypothetical protein CEV31_0742 [Brucella thiophenivorans]
MIKLLFKRLIAEIPHMKAGFVIRDNSSSISENIYAKIQGVKSFLSL